MNYQRLLKEVAKKYHTTPREVEKEMQSALKAAGLTISAQAFISLCSSAVKKDYNS